MTTSQISLTPMRRQHLAAEGAALQAKRLFCAWSPNCPQAIAWRQAKIDQVLDHYINTYSLACRVEAGGPL